MPISETYEAIFIHIPKNAGESIEKTLGMYEGPPEKTYWGVVDHTVVLQHLSANALKQRLNDDDRWDSYHKFAVVRNPWSKAVSEYQWYLNYGPKISFNSWVVSLANRIKINSSINVLEIGHNLPQSDYIYDGNRLLIDSVLKFENIADEFRSLCSKQNWDVQLKYTKDTASKWKLDFRDIYDEQSVEIISNIYQEDINRFGYNKDQTFADYSVSSRPITLEEISALSSISSA